MNFLRYPVQIWHVEAIDSIGIASSIHEEATEDLQ